MRDSGSLAVFKVTARDQGRYKGLRGHLLHTVTFFVLFKSAREHGEAPIYSKGGLIGEVVLILNMKRVRKMTFWTGKYRSE